MPTASLLLLASLTCGEPETFVEVSRTTAPKCSASLGWYEPRVGDIILFQSVGALTNFVYVLGCSPGTTHCGIVLARPDGSLGLYESPGTGLPVMVSDIPSRLQYFHGRVWIRQRSKPISKEQSACMTRFACAQEGKDFALSGVFIPPFGKPIRKAGKERCLNPEALDRPRWFCSELVVAACVEGGLLKGTVVKPRMTDPQDLRIDRYLDLSFAWEKPVRWHRCGDRTECWWSQNCAGERQWWKH